MIKHISRATRIFIGITIITLLLTYVALILSERQEISLLSQQVDFNPRLQRNDPPRTMLNTTDWKNYDDAAHSISFLYPKDWKIETETNIDDFYTIVITPAKSPTSIYIYVSKTGYLGLDGLNKKPYAIDSAKGIIINETLIGVQAGEYYYTFDGSFTPSMDNEFYTLIHTVKFD
jgi:hypothetical protein